MTPDCALRQGDLLPTFPFNAAYADGSPIDLTGATVVFFMLLEGSTTNKINGAACVITDPINGAGYYAWQGTDTDTPGDYLAFITATYLSTKQISVPDLGFSRVKITAKNEAI